MQERPAALASLPSFGSKTSCRILRLAARCDAADRIRASIIWQNTEAMKPMPRICGPRAAKFICWIFVFGWACKALSTSLKPQTPDRKSATYTSPLPTGVRLDPAGDFVNLGSMPLGMALAPGGDRAAVVLSGWREQGIQIVDLKSRSVTQMLAQDAAFYGVAFSRDGRELYVSGGNDDSIFCYGWENGTAALQHKIVLSKPGEKGPDGTGARYPAGIAVARRGNLLYVAENVGDSLAVVNPESSEIVQRFPTDHYPYAVEAAADGNVYVSAWGGDTVSIFHARADGSLTYVGRLRVGIHPSALAANDSGTRLYVALASTSQIAVIETRSRKILRYLNDAPSGGPAEGSTPNALALSHDQTKLYAAEADNNAVAVFDVSRENSDTHVASGEDPLVGRIPTDWYPTGVLDAGDQMLILTGKGHGSYANPDGPTPGEKLIRPLGYDLGQLNGTLRLCPAALAPAALAAYSQRVAEANNWRAPRPSRKYPPFRHVVYIIKENRTYDQVFGDLKEGDGDPKLVFFGQAVSPNHHALARRFGLFDRFFTNAEVSSQGHLWSTAAYVTDYGEKTIPSGYADKRADVDGEEAIEPPEGFLWTLAKKKGVPFRDYGEMVKSDGWPVTQREVLPDVSPTYPPFNFQIKDQVRADAWIAELNQFVHDGEMPALEVLHLPSDHTAGGRPGLRTPRAFMADNDLALGRIVEALSHSPFWKDTVVFVLEDDSQSGPDHVDSHRSVFFSISAYSRPGVVHRFLNTTDVVAAIEDILGLGRLSKFDYFSRSLTDAFTSTPDLTPYSTLPAQVNLDELNASGTPAAKMSEGLDFSAPDRVNDEVLNAILWSMIKGKQSVPEAKTLAPLHALQLSQ